MKPYVGNEYPRFWVHATRQKNQWDFGCAAAPSSYIPNLFLSFYLFYLSLFWVPFHPSPINFLSSIKLWYIISPPPEILLQNHTSFPPIFTTWWWMDGIFFKFLSSLIPYSPTSLPLNIIPMLLGRGAYTEEEGEVDSPLEKLEVPELDWLFLIGTSLYLHLSPR